MKKLFALSALALTACGGGGSDSPSQPSISSTPASSTPAEVVYYKEIKNAIPSLSLYYNRTCGKDANSFILPTIDANKDGRKDLFVVLWCNVSELNMVYDGPVKNTVVSLLQNNDGSYRLGNQEVFGKDYVEITGALGEGANIGIGDFNGDGKEDIAVAPSLEDGRRYIVFSDGSHSWQTKLTVFLSKPDSGYSVEAVGNTWTYNTMVVLKGTDRDRFYSGGRVWSYQNNQWISELNELSKIRVDRTTVFFQDYVSMNLNDGKNLGWQIGKFDESKNFQQLESLIISELKTVPVYNDSTKVTNNEYLTTIDNVDYVAPGFNSICTMPGNNSNELIIMAELQAVKLLEKYTGQKLEWTVPGKNNNVDWNNFVTRIIAYKISNGKLSRINVPELNKDITTTHYLNCVDMNNDNRKDLVVYRWGTKQEKPVIFLNTTNGFTEVSSSKIPEISTVYNGHSMLATDLNGDGKPEIMYGPGLGYKKDYAGNYDDYQIYTAVSPL